MKNFKKVLKELLSVSPDFYVSGSLSLYVFHYITRTPKDLDLHSEDPKFLEMAKEMQALFPVPILPGWDNTNRRKSWLNREHHSPEILTLTPEEWARKEFLRTNRSRKPEYHAAFMLHGIKVEVFNRETKKHHIVNGHKFVDPSEVLYYKSKYLPLKRQKDLQDVAEIYKELYPERAAKYVDEKIRDASQSCIAHSFKEKDGLYFDNDLPRHFVECVMSGQIKPRSTSSYSKDVARARKKRALFLKIFNRKEEPVEPLSIDRYLSTEIRKIDANTFKLYGYSKDYPMVKFYKNRVVLADEYFMKFGSISLPRKVFNFFAEENLWENQKQLVVLGEKSEVKVKLCPSWVYIADKAKKIKLPWEAFTMLKLLAEEKRAG